MATNISCPHSNPLQLEFLLSIHRDTGLSVEGLLDGTVAWLESMRAGDGALKNPATLLDYPLAPWWRDWVGQKAPDAITGQLIKLGLCGGWDDAHGLLGWQPYMSTVALLALKRYGYL